MTQAEPVSVPDCESAWRVDCAGTPAFVVLHRTVDNRSFGGIRIRDYRDETDALADAAALAQAMSRKLGVTGIRGGGAKTVMLRPPAERREEAIRTLGRFVGRLEGRYCCGPDLGFTEDDGRVLREATSSCAHGDLAGWTARSVRLAMDAACDYLDLPEPGGRRVAVLGLGAVGRPLAEGLLGDGDTVTAGDIRPGLAAEIGAVPADPDAVHRQDCDVFAPCAGGGAIGELQADELRCRVVCGAANNPVTRPQVIERLHDRGILYVPDFVANCGALILGASNALGEGVLAEERLRGVPALVERVLLRAERDGVTPWQAAADIADRAIARMARTA